MIDNELLLLFVDVNSCYFFYLRGSACVVHNVEIWVLGLLFVVFIFNLEIWGIVLGDLGL